MNDYMAATGVPHHLKKVVRSYYDFLHKEDIDVLLKPDDLLASLPDSISSRIRVATSIKAIEGVTMFDDLEASAKIVLAQKIRAQVRNSTRHFLTGLLEG